VGREVPHIGGVGVVGKRALLNLHGADVHVPSQNELEPREIRIGYKRAEEIGKKVFLNMRVCICS
jgi:hypothetical protein